MNMYLYYFQLPLSPFIISYDMTRVYSSAGTNFKVGGTLPEIFVVPLQSFGPPKVQQYKSLLMSSLVMDCTVWSVYCLLFAINK